MTRPPLRDFVKRPTSEVAEVLTVVFAPITFIRVCAVPFTNKSMVSWQTLVNKPQSLSPYLVYRRHLSINVTWHNFEHVRDNVKTTPSAALAERLSCGNSADTSYSKELYVKARRYA